MNTTEFVFELSETESWRCLFNVVCGRGHGLEVAVYTSMDGQTVEITGRLPVALRANFKRAHTYWERRRPNSVSWDDAGIVWQTTNHHGPRFAIPSQDHLIGLLIERRDMLSAKGGNK